MDVSLIQANASNYSIVNKESLTRYLNKSYQTLESRLEQPQDKTMMVMTTIRNREGGTNKRFW